MDRPELTRELKEETFRNFYYLKAELTDFCKQEDLQSSGSKLELTERISRFLKTGEKSTKKILLQSPKKAAIRKIGLDDLIEEQFVCSEVHRSFFQDKIGKTFSFNVAFQKWLKENAGETYEDAIVAYQQILAEKKTSKTAIEPQFEYNTYIRDFFAANSKKTLKEAIHCWKYKKSIVGHNKYAEADLKALRNFDQD